MCFICVHAFLSFLIQSPNCISKYFINYITVSKWTNLKLNFRQEILKTRVSLGTRWYTFVTDMCSASPESSWLSCFSYQEFVNPPVCDLVWGADSDGAALSWRWRPGAPVLPQSTVVSPLAGSVFICCYCRQSILSPHIILCSPLWPVKPDLSAEVTIN